MQTDVMATTIVHDLRGWLNTAGTTPSEYEILRAEYEILRELDEAMVYTLVPTFVCVCLLLVMGLVGNTVSFLVYRKFSPSSTRTYIMAISLLDLSTNVISYPTAMVEMSFHYTFVHAWQCRVIRFVTSAQIIASAFVLVAVALDRHRRVCHSLKKQQSDRDALRAVIICIIVALVVSIPYGVMTGRGSFATHVHNVTGFMCTVDDRYEGTLWHNLYQWLTGAGMFACLATMCVSYARIACHVSKHKKRMMAVDRGTACHPESSNSTTATSQLLQAAGDSSSCGSDAHGRGTGADENKPVTSLKAEPILLKDVGTTAVEDKAQVWRQPARDLVQPGNTPRGRAEGHVTELTLARPEISGKHLTKLTASCHEDDAKQVGTGTECSQDKSSRTAVQTSVAPDSRCSAARQLFGLSCRSRGEHGAARAGKHAGRAKKMSSRTTLIMFLLTAIFIVSFLPYWAVVTVRAAIGFDIHAMPPWLFNLTAVAVQSFFLSSSVNALVYGCCSARFREECRHLCSCTSRR